MQIGLHRFQINKNLDDFKKLFQVQRQVLEPREFGVVNWDALWSRKVRTLLFLGLACLERIAG